MYQSMGSGQVKDGGPNKTQTSQWTPEITGTIDRERETSVFFHGYRYALQDQDTT